MTLEFNNLAMLDLYDNWWGEVDR